MPVKLKHVANKNYFIALQNAFFVWNESKMVDLSGKMMEDGHSKEKIEVIKY